MNRFIIADPNVCIGCKTCMAACSEEHQRVGLQIAPRLHVTENGTMSAPLSCHHCEDAPCAQVCPVDAIKHVNNSIQLNEMLCVSCKLCGIACPFGSIQFSGSRPFDTPKNYISEMAPSPPSDPLPVSSFLDWKSGVRAVAVKCNLCEHSPTGPACVKACPTDAIHLISRDDLMMVSLQKRKQTMEGLNSPLPMSVPEQES